MNDTEVSCPNCLGPAIREGNKITCESCDAVFTFTKTGVAKLKDIGRLNALEERMDRQENLLQGLLPESEPKPEPKDEPKEDSILG